MKAYRQGDVVIIEAELPPDAQEIEHDGVLAYGEATGHKHQLVGGEVRYFRDSRGELFFEVTSRFVDLNHGSQPSVKSEGHFAHRLPQLKRGLVYKYQPQREADWLSEVTRDVAD